MTIEPCARLEERVAPCVKFAVLSGALLEPNEGNKIFLLEGKEKKTVAATVLQCNSCPRRLFF